MRFVILLLALLAIPAFGAQPPSITLTLLPATTLPGLPVSFLLTITNPSDQPVRFSDQAALSATATTGTFDVDGLSYGYAAHLPTDQMEKCNAEYCFTVPAKSVRQLVFDAGPMLGGNEFFADKRLCVVGKYTMEMTLYFDGPDQMLIPVRTNSQTLSVSQPTGVDASAWQSLLDANDGKCWGTFEWASNGQIAAPTLRAHYPSSTYAIWTSALGPVISSADADARFDRALSTTPPPSIRDGLLWSKASFLAQWSKNALLSERDIDKTIAFSDEARATFTTLRDVAVTDRMRSLATGALSHLYTRAVALDDLRFYAASDPPAPGAVIPRVECVTKGIGQSFTARFGYSNPNRVIKVLQIGPDNQVTPAPRQQGQPLVFKPGDHASVFVASSPGGELKWHLDGSTATVTVDFPTQCTP
ncbi:MAG TPA: hypothetical protein VLC46_09610 [Thermoanaerobaculia bacterium]|jgi:hypothetical protein|nr:hypothetical protein [Thermoanaerobaculia bacterium]